MQMPLANIFENKFPFGTDSSGTSFYGVVSKVETLKKILSCKKKARKLYQDGGFQLEERAEFYPALTLIHNKKIFLFLKIDKIIL